MFNIKPDNQQAEIKCFYSKFPAKKGSQLKPTGESQKQKPKLTNVILDVGCNDDDEDDGSFFKNFLKSKGFSFEKDEIRFTSGTFSFIPKYMNGFKDALILKVCADVCR